MVTCCMHGCSSRSGREPVTFHRIPKCLTRGCQLTIENSKKQRAAWLARINRKTITDATVTSSTVVCSRHFIHGTPANYMDVSNPDWAPSQNLGHEITAKPKEDRYRRRQNRAQQRRPLRELHINVERALNVGENEENVDDSFCVDNNDEFVDDAANVGGNNENVDYAANFGGNNENVGGNNENGDAANIVENNENFNDAVIVNESVSVSCQTDLDCFALVPLLSKPAKFSEEHLAKDKKCRFYTGLPSLDVLKLVFDFVAPHIKKNYNKVSISKFQEFASVLARLRLGLLEEDVADRLEISQGCYSKIFNLWVPVMAQCCSNFIVWPDRETLRKTTPECFINAFGRSVAVVIDCFEVQAATPSGLLPKAQTYSHYKKNTTAKFLIGMTPQGTVSYISPAWGGRTSDKFITEHSPDFLDKLLPGDVILADRGFDIGEVTGEVMARVITPSYMHGRSQLSSDDVQSSRQIANVRIHVERIIGLVRRKFRILEQKLDISLMQRAKTSEDSARIDDVVQICCALSNLSAPIVPMSDLPENV